MSMHYTELERRAELLADNLHLPAKYHPVPTRLRRGGLA
jgi:hypothetical protein